MSNFKINKINKDLEIDILVDIGDIPELGIEGYTFKQFKDEVDSVLNETNTIIINIMSYGGDLYQALAIYDYIKNLDVKVITNVIGASASAATVISLAGDERYITENSKYLVHKASTMFYGNADELSKDIEEMKQLDAELIKIYVENSNLNYEQVEALMREEKFISAEKAVEYGFIDKIKNKDMNLINKKTISKMTNMRNEFKTVMNSLKEEKEQLEAQNKELQDKLAALEEEKETETSSEEEETNETEETSETDEEFEALKAENTELKEKMDSLLKEVEDFKANKEKEEKEKITNTFINKQVASGVINASTKDKWVSVVNSVGVEEAEVLMKSVNKTKISNAIVNNEVTDPLKAWKAGKITTETYMNLVKK